MFWPLVGVGLATLIYFCMVKPFKYWKIRDVPQQEIWTIWLQNVQRTLQLTPLADEVHRIYNGFDGKRYAGIYQFSMPTLLLRDPDLIKQIIVKDFDHFVDHYQFVPQNNEPLWERNLFSLKGEKWRDMRATLSPSFTSSKMKMMFGLMSECAEQFVCYFETQNASTDVEMKEVFTRFTNDIIASTAFGVICNSLKNPQNEFYLKGKEITNLASFWSFVKFILMMGFPPLAKLLGVTFFPKSASSFFKKVIKNNIEDREQRGIVRPDMIHLLMEASKGKLKNEVPSDDEDTDVNARWEEKLQKTHLTDDDIVAQALLFFFAGFETVSQLMSFMAYELGTNPDIQDRLLGEVDDILNECDGSLTYEALQKMKYLDMIVSETLRKWPGGVALDRVCVKPYTIQPTRSGEKPVHLKKGNILWIPVIGLHRDPQFFQEPDRFDPERFNNDNKSSINSYAYLPFGAGPRNCIGNRFALMETKVVFFHILSKFRFTTTLKTEIPLKFDRRSFQLSVQGGVWLGLTLRK